MNPLEIKTTITRNVRITKLLEDMLIPSICKIHVVLEVTDLPDSDSIKSRITAMATWIDQYLDCSVAYNVHTDMDTEILESISNHIMMCPEEPHDYLLALLIHTKLQAFGGENVTVISTNIECDTNDGLGQIVSGSANTVLPPIEEWIGSRHFHKVPWWSRTDSSMTDIRPEPNEDLSKVPELGEDLIGETASSTIKSDKPAARLRIITNDD